MGRGPANAKAPNAAGTLGAFCHSVPFIARLWHDVDIAIVGPLSSWENREEHSSQNSGLKIHSPLFTSDT